MDAPLAARATILFDSDCGFCRWTLGWILRWDRRRRLVPIEIQAAAAEPLLAELPEAERLRSWHLSTA